MANYTWSSNWIQEFESPWSILEKFKFANSITNKQLFQILGSEELLKIKGYNNTGNTYRNLFTFAGLDEKKTKEILGINLLEYSNYTMNLLIPNGLRESKIRYFHHHIKYCEKCLNNGYHSMIHQLKFFENCPYHKDEELKVLCSNCQKNLGEYSIEKTKKRAFSCSCGAPSRVYGKKILETFKTWQTKMVIEDEYAQEWLDLLSNYSQKKLFVYPFANFYLDDIEYNEQYKHSFSELPKMILKSFNINNQNNQNILKNYSSNVLSVKNNQDEQIKTYVIDTLKRFSLVNGKIDKDDVSPQIIRDSKHFDIYKQSRTIYKAVTRYILNNYLADHKICVQIHEKMKHSKEPCPYALSFVLWKMECEGVSQSSQIFNAASYMTDLGFKIDETFLSIFPKGPYNKHLEELLHCYRGHINPTIGFLLADLNVSSINYILSNILFQLLLERYKDWLEAIIDLSKADKRGYPKDFLPTYLVDIDFQNNNINFFYSDYCEKRIFELIEKINNSERVKCKYSKDKWYGYPENIVLRQINNAEFYN